MVGAHVPVRGGLARGGLAYAERVGAEAVQVFVTNPRGWATSAGDPAEDAAFRELSAQRDLPSFIHAPYLVNFGSPTPDTLARSVDTTRHALLRAAQIGARGVVVHAGSAVAGARREDAMRQVHDHLLPLLDELPEGGPRLLVEPTAGGGGALAARVDDLPAYLDALEGHPQAGFCLDTCHLFAAGHPVDTAAGMRTTLTAAAAAVGRDRINLVHVNDSREPCGSTLDRHAAIGTGRIGLDAFAVLFTHPAVRGVPMITETPEADVVADLATLKGLRDRPRGAR